MTGFELALACLALNVYHEARSEPLTGQYAVAFVTINRARETNADICDVVFASKQFSWTEGARDASGKLRAKYMPHGTAWTMAKDVARVALDNPRADFTRGATHFHADYIATPVWTRNMLPLSKYGRHYFYK